MNKILVVDDNEQNLYLLQALLQGHGYEVVLAEDGAQALEKAQRDPPHLILSDILMPVMDGFTLCRGWKKDAALKAIPFVFFTATYTDPQDEEFALSLGAERFIVKPVEPDVLVDIVQEVLEEQQAGRLVAPRQPVEEEAVHFREYSETLIRKLEDKMVQLKEANRTLERQIAERERAERTLVERVKELTCLFAVSRDMREQLNTDDLCKRIIEHLVLAMQAPEITVPVIELDDRRFASERYISGLSHGLHAEIRVGGEGCGRLSVYYADDMPFLIPEEQDLLNTIGEELGLWLGRKQAESQRDASLEALAAERNLLRTLIDSIPDAIHVKDCKSRFLAGNVAVAEHVGVASPDALLGKTDYDFFPQDVAEQLSANEQEVIQSGQPAIDREELLVDSSGNCRWVSTVQVPLRDAQGDVVGLVGVSRDITERVQAEKERENLQAQLLQSQKMEAVGQLTAGIAHDFNNLLMAINGFAQLIQLRLAPDDPSQEMVGRIWASGQRAAGLVAQLMAFSRKQIIDPQVLALNAVVTDMDDMLRRVIREDVELKTVLAPDLWPIHVDPTQIEQVIVNLAVNAADAMPDGGKLTIETSNVVLDEAYLADHLEAELGEHVLLAVSDTGVGMSPEVQEHIFEPFYTTKERGEGTGLGLATVFGGVAQNGGHISVHSQEGQGTTFKIYLPRAKESGELSPRGEGARAMPAGGETILLVEDEPHVRDLARQVLEGQGYTLLEAGDGQQALALAANHAGPIHLLLTDVIMPGMSGSTLSERLVQSHPDVRVLYMSGHTEGTIKHHGVLGKGAAFLPKPFSPFDLARKVRAVLDE